MWNYFKPLRRKLGVATLVLACVFTAGWVRSLLVVDVIGVAGKYFPGTKSYHEIACFDGVLEWRQVWSRRNGDYSRADGTWRTTSVEGERKSRLFEYEVEQQHEFCVFRVEGGSWGKPDLRPAAMGIIVVPYWSIVIPLTVLSAWLLLVKQQANKPTIALEM